MIRNILEFTVPFPLLTNVNCILLNVQKITLMYSNMYPVYESRLLFLDLQRKSFKVSTYYTPPREEVNAALHEDL